MSDEKQDQNADDTTEATAAAAGELEDLAPSENESGAVTGGSKGGPGAGWDKVTLPPV